MDLKGAIYKAFSDKIDMYKACKDKKERKVLKKEYEKLGDLLSDVAVKERYEDYITGCSGFTEEDFKGKKIISDARYNQIYEEWCEKTGQKLLLPEEEEVREEIELVKKYHPEFSKEELDEIIEEIKDEYEKSKIRRKEKLEFQKSREEFYGKIQKMSRRKRNKLLDEIMTSDETVFKYKGKIVLGEDEE